MKLLHTVVILTLSGLNRVVANSCGDGKIPFVLGEKDHTDMHEGGKIPYLNDYWRKTFQNGKDVSIKVLKDTDTMVEGGYRIGWKIVENTNPVQVVGIGVANNHVKDYTDDDEGLIQGSEGLEIQFARYIVTDVTVGVILLNSDEKLRWKAILDDEIVQEGSVSGKQPTGDPNGEFQFDIHVAGGFEELVFGVDSSKPNTEYLLEYIEGCYYENSAPVPGPVCTGPTGRFSGDPHITTYDGLKYDCQGEGEYVIAKNNRFNVQGRFVLGGNVDKKVSVTKGIVFETPGAPKIQAVVPESNDAQTCPFTFFVDDVEEDIRKHGTGSAEITAVFSGKAVLFYHPSTGARIEITVKKSTTNGCVMAAQVCLPDGEANYVGLLGIPDGDLGNDWTMPNGTVAIPSSEFALKFEPAFNYCTTWCVAEPDSVFFYGGSSYSDYNQDCSTGAYDDTVEQEIVMNILFLEEIFDICGDPFQNGDQFACVIDGIVGGTEDAYAYLEVEEELDELKAEPPSTSIEERIETGVSAYIAGDPHIKTWGGDNYDFHGVCDLLLLKNPDFKEGLGMDIQVRSKKYNQWAYISSAVLRIGKETLEVSGRRDEHGNSFWINGVTADSYDIRKVAKEEKTVLLSQTISGHPITFMWVSDKKREFEVGLGKNQQVVIKAWNNFVRVDLVGARASDFGGSLGLMGKFPNGFKVARDGKTIMNDSNEFGMEWQVLDTESGLFHNMEGPQAPEKCAIPVATTIRRRLRESIISHEEAKEACSRVTVHDLDICIFDVMATNDIETAGAY